MSIDLKQIKRKPVVEEPRQDKPESLSFLHKEIKLTQRKFSLSKKENFYSELGMLLGSGLDIKTAFTIFVKEQNNEQERSFFSGIYENLVEGNSLSEALNQTGKISLHEYYSLRIGEETGKIIEVLEELSTYFEVRLKQQRQLVSTFSYPVLVIITAFVVVIFMMNFIVPMFQDVFKRFNGELPALTRFVMHLSHILTRYFWLYTGVFIVGCVSLWSLRKTFTFRKVTSLLLLKTPVVNRLIKKLYMARFCQSMTLMISAHIPLITALDLVSKIIGFYPYEKALKKMGEDVLNGKMLYE
ncbi:MAG: type II secretion system F family protein, partial [Bacteroidota bacterium]|nr:type II secretion system F family protein [Bacteroidota bacterium]